MLASIITLLALASASELTTRPDPQSIYGGSLVPTCGWPSNVALVGAGGQCSGSLVHPEIVVTAAHCLEGGPLDTLVLGEDLYAPAYQVPLAECVRHPNYPLDYPDYADFMYCRLAQPLVGVPTVPILMGCEVDEVAPGASAVLAGYGLADDGGPEGSKRMVSTTVEYLADTRVFFAGGTGKGTCNGDSGGPAYVQLQDGTWRVFGTTTGGEVCGDWGQSELIHEFVPWIEEHSGIDITPCHDADGTWAPTAECGAFPAEPAAPSSGSWDALCGGAAITPPSATCGAAFGEEDPEPPDGTTGLPPADTGDDPDPDGGDEDDGGDSAGSSDDGDAGDESGDAWPWPDATDGSQGEHAGRGCAIDRGAPAWSLLLVAIACRRRRRSWAC